MVLESSQYTRVSPLVRIGAVSTAEPTAAKRDAQALMPVTCSMDPCGRTESRSTWVTAAPPTTATTTPRSISHDGNRKNQQHGGQLGPTRTSALKSTGRAVHTALEPM